MAKRKLEVGPEERAVLAALRRGRGHQGSTAHVRTDPRKADPNYAGYAHIELPGESFGTQQGNEMRHIKINAKARDTSKRAPREKRNNVQGRASKVTKCRNINDPLCFIEATWEAEFQQHEVSKRNPNLPDLT